MTHPPIQCFVDGAPVHLHKRRVDTSDNDCAPWHPRRGWPVAIAHTRRSAYLSGSDSLNLPTMAGDQDHGDWHAPWSWWTPTYLGPDDRPYRADLWGPDGAISAAPGAAQLRDARAALALIEHPSSKDPEPVYAATITQAVIDIAWRAFHEGHEPPDRRTTYQWLSDDGDAQATQIAHDVATHIDNATLRQRWLEWAAGALQGEDPFYTEPAYHHAEAELDTISVNTVMVS